MVTTTWTQTAGMTGDTDTDNIENYAEQAEASKDAAAASEAAAAGSASSASTSASSAATDAASALSSKNAAAVSEANSATSEANSASSAASASTSATNANTSASNSATSAAASASSAAAASTSEANSATSAAAALVSENASAASETAASSSASAASTSETNAAASETAAAASETAAQTAQAAAEAAEAATEALFDQFGDQYLGPKASDPTVDNDGNPLAEGAVYFNTTDDVLKFYSGSAWVAPESVATTAAAAAQAAQAAAETAETNAETAETNAAASASSASSSASAASTSASEAAASAASINLSSIDIDGGTIDGTVIGGSVPAAGSFTTGSFTGDVAHGDNVKATFGASADLQVYHDGSDSYIYEGGTGNLNVIGTNIRLKSFGTNELYFAADQNGPVTIYHNGLPKLQTSSTGIDVTGTVVADDITVQTSSPDFEVISDGDGFPTVRIERQNGVAKTDASYYWRLFSGGDLSLVDETNSNANRMLLTTDGNVRFYNTTAGGSHKLEWNAASDDLKFGDNVKATFGASSDLQIYHDGSNSYISEQGTGNLKVLTGYFTVKSADDSTVGFEVFEDAQVQLRYNNSVKLATTSTGIAVTGSVDFGNWTITESGGSLYFATGGTNKMKLDASGNLDVVGSVNSNATL